MTSRQSGVITVAHFEERPRVGSEVSFDIAVENDGSTTWSASTHVSLRWRSRDLPGQPILKNSQAIAVAPLAPKAVERLRGSLPVPINSVMNVIVEFELRDADGDLRPGGMLRKAARRLGLFREADRVSLVRHVEGHSAKSSPSDFGYEDAYRAADLETNWWSIVGPATREEHELLGRGKLETLRANGLTATSKVLDVGCGTGQLTEPLLEFLSDDGLYYGTDIVEQAIDFCRRRFKRPNFRFIRNDQTAIPIEGIRFDIIYLGSVFTHMFPDDIEKLLGHLRRLLAPEGCVIADAFVSPAVDPYVGSRAMIVLNEPKLIKSFAVCGFAHSELDSSAWNEDCRRVVYKLRGT